MARCTGFEPVTTDFVTL